MIHLLKLNDNILVYLKIEPAQGGGSGYLIDSFQESCLKDQEMTLDKFVEKWKKNAAFLKLGFYCKGIAPKEETILDRLRPALDKDPLFTCVDATLEDLEKNGWHITENMGGWYFERRIDGRPERVSVPMWLAELVRNSNISGKEQAQFEMRKSLGLQK